MPYILGNPQDVVVMPNGVTVELTQPYSSFDSMGVTVIIVAAGISLLCSVVLLGIMGVSLWKNRSSPSEHFFVRTHAAAYFTSLLVADLIQGVGALMSIQWVSHGGITLNQFCSAQGAIKNAGNLAISLWTLMLSIHTFCLLFLRWKPKDWILYVSLIFVWLLVGVIVLIGPAAIQRPENGPYYGISGFWCWIADPYPAERITLEYAWMFASAILSFLLYMLTFLRLRGNITVENGRVKLRMIGSDHAWRYNAGRDSADIEMTAVAKGMIAFPILFAVLVLPIAVCRFIAWSGKDVPIEATIFADAVFQLTGVFAIILFITTRSLIPAYGVLPGWFTPRPKLSAEVLEHGVQPYHVHDFASAHGFEDMRQREEHEHRFTVSLPPRNSASLSSPPPSRPPRPNSLLPMDAFPLPPLPQHHVANRMTARTEGSRYTQATGADTDFEFDAMAEYAWDEVDLSRRPTRELVRDRDSSDSGSMRFTLSAYEYDDAHARGVRAAASGAGIDLGAGRDARAEEDDAHLVPPPPRTADLDSVRYSDAYRGFDMVTPEPPSRHYRATGRPF